MIRYYNSWIDREKEQIIFVTEMMSSGSLKHYLRKNTIIRWNAVKRWCKQILTGLEFLHANHIIHRDIKCDNLFINGTTGDLRIGKDILSFLYPFVDSNGSYCDLNAIIR